MILGITLDPVPGAKMKKTAKTIIIAVSLNNPILSKTTQKGNTWEVAGMTYSITTNLLPFYGS